MELVQFLCVVLTDSSSLLKLCHASLQADFQSGDQATFQQCTVSLGF